MSAAAGAPPPPPPPPPPRAPTSFDDLPAELLLMIFEHTGVGNYLNLALAIYPILRRHNLVPELTIETLIRVATDWQRHGTMTNTPSTAAQLPAEMWAQIIEYLEPSDILALGFAMGPSFYHCHGPPSQETMDRLRIWSRRVKRKK